MMISKSGTTMAGAVIAAAAGCTIVAMAATSASASTIPTPPASQHISSGGGAFDLDGNLVESRTYVGAALPSDLGELEQSGTATADSTPVTGTLAP
jgi:hypothetical protein